MASIDDESGSSSKKTVGKHGVTRLQKIHKAKSNGKRIEVQWNSRGQPIKHNSKTFASFIGVTVRRCGASTGDPSGLSSNTLHRIERQPSSSESKPSLSPCNQSLPISYPKPIKGGRKG
ncbi:unnamed protein product [Vicia faba]|uniref:Uncharacterized protein n=1 Tax=Vicia faba TaxID=3906 RepID=A0AAV0ZUT6_VICFA|nr:unnamed protein product [Vicia faba]